MANEMLVEDLGVIIVYFALVMAVGLWSSCTTNTGSVKGYFMAGRDMIWIPVGASIYATNFGSHFFIGMAGSAAAGGIAVTVYEWHAVFILILLGWFFVPVYVSSGAYTMPQYLKKRFGGKRLRIYLSCLAIFLLIVQRISVVMYAGAVFIQQSVGWDMYSSIISVTLITSVYTIIGGLSAVIWTDALQTVIMVFGTFWLLTAGLVNIGGIDSLFEKYMHAIPNITKCANNVTSGYPRADSLHMFRDPINGDIPWPGLILGLTPMAILAWCTDQVMVQRVLAAKTHSHAKGGVVLAGWLKLLSFFVVVLPGMMGRIMFPNEVGCADPDICESVCGNRNGCTNIAYPKLVMNILPKGVRGLVLACMLSALMSTLTSVFNSSSSIFTLDLWTRLRPKAKERELMIIGRIFILFMVGLSIAWIPILDVAQGGQLWDYVQAMQSYLAPPWVVVFLLGIGWKGTTEKGAFWSLMIGLAVGMTRMIIDLAYPKPACGEPETRPEVLYKVNFLYFAFMLSVIVCVVCVVVSLITEKRPEEKLRRCTWSMRYSEPREDTDEEEDFDNPAARDAETHHDKKHQGMTDDRMTMKERIYNILCCYSSFKPKPVTKEMEEAEVRKYRGEGEASWVPRFLDANAVLVMAVTVFLLGLYG